MVRDAREFFSFPLCEEFLVQSTSSLTSATRFTEQRQSRRINCDITTKATRRAKFGNIKNISVDGCFVEADRDMAPGQSQVLRFDAHRFGEVRARAEVVRSTPAGVGMRFVGLAPKEERHLLRLVAHLNSIVSQRYEAQSLHQAASDESAISDVSKIFEILEAAKQQQSSVVVIPGERNERESFRVETLTTDELALSSDRPTSLKIGEQVVVLLTLGFDSYFFPASVLGVKRSTVELDRPRVLSFSERRGTGREQVARHSNASFRVTVADAEREYPVLERSENGFSVLARLDSESATPAVGTSLKNGFLQVDDEVTDVHEAVVTHVTPVDGDSEGRRARIGFSLQAERHKDLIIAKEAVRTPERKRVKDSIASWLRGVGDRLSYLYYQRMGRARAGAGSTDKGFPHVVQFRTEAGRNIVGLLNRSWPSSESKRAPLVVVVPGYAGRKETMSALASTVVHNFEKQQADVAVLRFDGVNNLGESDKDLGCESEEKHTLHYCLSDSVADILAAIAWAKNNPYVDATDIVLVSVSFSSIAVRIALTRPESSGVNSWIAYMGAADAQNAFMNVAGNFDVWGNYVRGIPNGIVTVGGCMLDGDWCCRDGERLNGITLDDARRDMAKIDVPITWISGKYDAWMNPSRVRDIMSVSAPGDRQIIEVDTGHVPTSSDEALAQFRLVAGLIWRHLSAEQAEMEVPPRGWVGLLAKREWDRVRKNHQLNREGYWQDYMAGGELGYDLLRYLPSYREFCRVQVDELDAAGARVLELGSGTGIAAGYLLGAGPRQLTCLDVSEPALHQIRTTLGSDPRLHMLRGNLDSGVLPFENDCYDAILCSLVLSYLTNPGECLSECMRVLRPGGRLVISTMKPDADNSILYGEFLRVLEETPEAELPRDRGAMAVALRGLLNRGAELFRLEEEGLFTFFSEQEFKDLVLNAGFTMVRTLHGYGSPPQAIVLVCQKPGTSN